MLENRVVSDVRPHDKAPVPISRADPSKRDPAAPLSTQPFSAELETLCNIWLPVMPFPSSSVLSHQPTEIVRCAVKLSFPPWFGDKSIPWNHASLILVIGTPGDLDAGFKDLRKAVVGKHQMSQSTSVQLITSFRYDSKSGIGTFFLTRPRFSSLTDSNPALEIGIIDVVFWRLASVVAPFSQVRVIGDLDGIDSEAKVAKEKGRVSEVKMKGMMGDLLAGISAQQARREADGTPLF